MFTERKSLVQRSLFPKSYLQTFAPWFLMDFLAPPTEGRKKNTLGAQPTYLFASFYIAPRWRRYL